MLLRLLVVEYWEFTGRPTWHSAKASGSLQRFFDCRIECIWYAMWPINQVTGGADRCSTYYRSQLVLRDEIIIMIAQHASGACNVNSRWTDCPPLRWNEVPCSDSDRFKIVAFAVIQCHGNGVAIIWLRHRSMRHTTCKRLVSRCTRFLVGFCNKPVTFAHCWKLGWESFWWQPELLCSASILCCNHVEDILGVFGIMLLEGKKPCSKLGAAMTKLYYLQGSSVNYNVLEPIMYSCVCVCVCVGR